MAQSTKDPMQPRQVDWEPGQSSPERAVGQVGDGGWPIPGDEGYVHPDGTPQAVGQLQDNIRAAADRAAAGSIIHGAPAVERGGRPDATNMAVDRARNLRVPTNDERDADLTKFVRDGQAENTDRAAEMAGAESGERAEQPVTATAGPGGAPLDEDKPKAARK